jgi:hypothetical protein
VVLLWISKILQCSDVVLLDLPPNENLKIQCLGRVYRVEQEHEVVMWIKTLNGPYDQLQQARAARKYLAQLVGQAGIEIDETYVEELDAQTDTIGSLWMYLLFRKDCAFL